MSKKKSSYIQPTSSSIENVESAIQEYNKICGSFARAQLLKEHFSDKEIIFFVNELKLQKDIIDSDNPYDIATLEQAAQIRVQINRILKYQRDRLNEVDILKLSDQPADKEIALKYEEEVINRTTEVKELNTQWERLIKILSSTREQRLKVSSESKITLTSLIRSLDDVKYKERIGKHGELLKYSMKKKQQKMIEEGLIFMTNNTDNKDIINEEVSQIERKTTIKEEEINT